MSTTKCTGCPVFTMCLGDGIGVLFINKTVRRCYYCQKYYTGETQYLDKIFCDEFYTIAEEFFPGDWERTAGRGNATLACSAERCQKLLGKAPGWTRHHGFAINRNALRKKKDA